jgi:protein phosphatase
LTEEPVVVGDLLLLCSDGLSDQLQEAEILRPLLEPAADLDRLCRALVDRANTNGGDDNITALVIQVREDAEGRRAGVHRGTPGATTSTRRDVVGWLKRLLGA